ncbi:hypothetical protein LTR97_004141 [Elasticomyces elasticus]|uniref:Uncharacterized protein n=1 Tax=Elasticomyces elasticus TaxID=574655 RepID=A0AAN7VTV2_9PEZI|nr:hypothetical protein LTR97_004141 [Elasticomyces elasticus]
MFELRAVRSSAFWAVAALAAIAQVIVAAIIIRLTDMMRSETRLHAIGVAAATFAICSLLLLLSAVATRRLRTHGLVLVIFNGFAATVSLVASLLSIFLLGWAIRETRETDSRELASAGIALWTVLLLLQVAFYAYLLWPQISIHQEITTDALPIERPSLTKRSLSVRLTYMKPSAPPFARSASEPQSPTLSAFSKSPRSSWRDSLNQTIRPMTSKSRLLRQSFVSTDARSYRSGRPMSIDTIRPHDGFEAWDTSAVEEVPDTPSLPKALRMKLETIPGSRPVSPARALDGPFPAPRTPEDTPLPESPMTPNVGDDGFQHMPPLRRPSTHESHIHPLFRSESPNPPPLPSPGTVVTASPLAGQVVSPEHAMGWTLHSTQTWRPGSTTPVSPSGSRAGSVRSLRLQSTTAAEPLPSSPLHDKQDTR